MSDEVGEIGYADAMAELGDILAELERDDLDVDVLAERVRRAGEVDADHELVTELAHGRVVSRVVATAEDDDE